MHASKFCSFSIVVWHKGIDSLESARTYLKLYPCLPQSADPALHDVNIMVEQSRQLTLSPLKNESNPGRSFIDRHMRQIIMVFLEQSPKRLADAENEIIKKSLMCSIHIIQEDLKCVNELDLKGSEELPLCPTVNTLGLIFGKKQVYYKRGSINPMKKPGLPEVRNQLIKEFRGIGGFSSLTKYLELRIGHTSFPKHEHLQDILDGLREPESFQESLAIPNFAANDTNTKAKRQRLLLLRHASKCTAENGTCTITSKCGEMKVLWKHIVTCKDSYCKVQHCLWSKYVLSHYRRCRPSCNICDPVKDFFKNGLAVYSEDSKLEARALSKLMLKHELISFLCNPETNIARVERENICSVLKRIHQQHLLEQNTDESDADESGTDDSVEGA